MKVFEFLLAACILSIKLYAQSPERIIIETNNVGFVLSVGANGRVYQSYLGERLSGAGAYAGLETGKFEAYITGGMQDPFQPAIRVLHSNGDPSLELVYEGVHKISVSSNVTETVVSLKDPKYPVKVNLHYEAFANEDILKCWTEITNHSKSDLVLSNYASGMLHFKEREYWLTQFHGDWVAEMKMEETKLTSGIKEIDSKLGTRPATYQTPVFMLSLNGPSDENTGEVIAGTLAWTGNFQFHFELDQNNALRVISGINPYASAYSLENGSTFITPPFIFTYSSKGKGAASRNFHNWARSYGVRDGTNFRPVLYNNWETTDMEFDEKHLVNMFAAVDSLGADIFLLDDGWFGNKYPRNNDKAGLGDWEVNRSKLPGGIPFLIKKADLAGLKFGIWIEPEMVNPKSELYEKHPDWVLKNPERTEDLQRNQLVLDLSNQAVAEFVFHSVARLIDKNPGLAFIKWDCNRFITNGWSGYLKNKQSNLYVDYVMNLYKVLERLRVRYPHFPMMLCASGGGRADFGALQYFTDFWASDNTDAFERIYIQWGYTHFFPSLTLASHVTSTGKQSLKFRTDAAMMGKLGYDLDLSKMTPDELRFSREAVRIYKRLNEVIQSGDIYRLVSPYKENRAVLVYVSKAGNKAVVFNYNMNVRTRETFGKVRLEGLKPEKMYRVEEVNLFPGTRSELLYNGKIFSGDFLMKAGLDLNGTRVRPLTSSVIELTEVH